MVDGIMSIVIMGQSRSLNPCLADGSGRRKDEQFLPCSVQNRAEALHPMGGSTTWAVEAEEITVKYKDL